MSNSLNTVLAALTLAQLVETFNNLSAIVDSVEITKFASKDKGIARILKMLDRVNEYRHDESLPLIGIADDGKLFNIEPPKPVEAPKPAPAKKQAAKAPGRVAAVAPSDVIILMVAAGTNPKQAGAAVRFAHYASGLKVADYVEALGGDKTQALRDINWDTKKGWIKVVGAKSPEAQAALEPTAATTEQPTELPALPAPVALLMLPAPVAATLAA